MQKNLTVYFFSAENNTCEEDVTYLGEINSNVSNGNIFQHENGNIDIFFNGSSFRFIDVPGDGDCFYHSILKSSHLQQYQDVYSVQNILAQQVQNNIEKDVNLQHMLKHFGNNYHCWSTNIKVMHTWATLFDMVITSYIFRVRIVFIGNYINGFKQNDTQLIIHNILRDNAWEIHGSDTICVFFIDLDSLCRKCLMVIILDTCSQLFKITSIEL